MKNRITHLIIIWLCVSILLGQLGCAPRYQLPPPVSEETRARLVTIGVVSAQFIPDTELFTFAKGRISGAAKGLAGGTSGGAAVGAGIAIELGAATGIAAPLWLSAPVVGPAILIVVAAGAATGAIVGAITAIPAERVEEIEATLKNALIEMKMQENIRDHVFRTASEQTGRNFVLLHEGGPHSVEEKASYIFLVNKGIDTVLEVSVLSISFEGKGGGDPPLSLSMKARTRLIKTADDSILYENELMYRSPKRKFTDWAANDAKIFKEELARCYRSLAEKVVEEIFLLYNLLLKPAPRSGSGG